MKKLKLKSRSHTQIYIEMAHKIFEGWKVVSPPRKNIFGKWIVKLKKV